MSKSPAVVQQWIDMLPTANNTSTPLKQPFNIYSPNSKNAERFLAREASQERFLARGASFQSDDGSHCSSLESLLESRKPDPETVLYELGFGPKRDFKHPSRIPDRFLQPSKILPEIDFNKFLEEHGVKPLDQRPYFFSKAKAVVKPNSY
nr:unnamed protein product [Callosobruchus analis]